jgi:short-subunit dehydrogenase
VRVGRSVVDREEGESLSLECDLRSELSVQSLLARLDARAVEVSRFFWVASTLVRLPFAEHAPDDLTTLVDVNFRNALPVVLWGWKQLASATAPSSFTVISSTAATRVRPNESIYAATKSAQASLARTLAAENENPDVTVSLFLPGGMKTQLWSTYPHPAYETFMAPDEVASRIVDQVQQQTKPFLELRINRKSRDESLA